MHDKEMPAVTEGLLGSAQGIERIDLLVWRFSSAEIERLSEWQLRIRARADVLDLPLDELRLRFARWLVNHGKLSENMIPARETADVAALRDSPPYASEPMVVTECAPPRCPECPMAYESGHRNQHKGSLFMPRLLARLHAFIAGSADGLSESAEVEPHHRPPAEARFWGSLGCASRYMETWRPWGGPLTSAF